MKAQKLNWKKAKYVLYLSRFDFTLKYMLGVMMRKANRLSRRPDLKVEVENNNENQNLIKNEQIREMMEVIVKKLEITLVKNTKSKRKR